MSLIQISASTYSGVVGDFKLCFGCLAENQYTRHSDTVGGLPEPASTLCYTIKSDTPVIAKYNGTLKADPISFALLDELFLRYLSHYETGTILTKL